MDTLEILAIKKAKNTTGENLVIHTNQKILSGWKAKFIILKLRLSVLRIAFTTYKNPIKSIRFLLHLIHLRKSAKGNNAIKKVVKNLKRYYLGPYIPAWNGLFFKDFILSEMNRFSKINKPVKRFNNVFLAITKKCILQCEHCFEWDELNKKDVLDHYKIVKMVEILQKKGVNQVYFTGGEPMLKVNTMIKVINKFKNHMDFWILTSGYNLNQENAKKLKKAGLTGVVISLDHFEPKKHNEFRGNRNAYNWVEDSVKSALKNDIVVALSICITRSFATEQNIINYMKLAKKLNVSFVQFLEPKAIGHYKNKDVTLLRNQEELLEKMYRKINEEDHYKNYPIIVYHGFSQRKIGCFNAGFSGLYIDTDGDLNACPFCHGKTGNLLSNNFEENLNKLSTNSCPEYSVVNY